MIAHQGSTVQRLAVCAILCMVIYSEAFGADPPDDLLPLPETLARHFGVIGVRLQGSDQNLRVTHVRVGSPADRAGVLKDDYLRGADGYRLTTVTETIDYMQSRHPGSTVELHLIRDGQYLQLTCGVTDRRQLYGLMIEQQRPRPGLQPRHERWLADPDVVTTAITTLVSDLDAQSSIDSLREAFAEDASAYGYDTRLADVEFALHHPESAARPIAALASDLTEVSIVERIRAMATRLDPDSTLEPNSEPDIRPNHTPDAGPDAVFARWSDSPLYGPLFSVLSRAGQWSLQALPDSTLAADSIIGDITSVLRQFDEDFYLGEGERDQTMRHTATLRWAKQVDIHLMARALGELGKLAGSDALDRIRKAAKTLRTEVDPNLPSGFQGKLLFAQHSDWGWIIIGGDGPNVYGDDAALIVDLGGDDLYLGGGRNEGIGPVSVIIDYAGEDRYIDRRPGGVAGAMGGVVAIIDVKGDDLYEAGVLGVASAFAGGALLVDRGGHDLYLGEVLTQGAALFGIALLLDMKGNDLYSAAQYAQGFAGPRAVTALVDLSGNDRYVADRSRPSGYGTAGVYKGWAQGVGCGLRGFAAGGLGLLLDLSGDDEYRAGNFSQGVGYFFGLGGLVDTQGNDQYRATRYSQGSAAHQAIGVLIDVEGNDTYEGRIAANQGASWDASIAYLIDRAGDDSYHGAGLSQAAAAMNGYAVLYDGRGDDSYRSASGQADGGSTRYWGGRLAPNVAILIDAAGHDVYDLDGRADATQFRRSHIGLFWDLE